MSEQYRFFDSIDGEDERFYTADEFAEYFRQVISTGILNGGTNLKVSSKEKDMNIEINEGYAWLEGYLYKIDTEPLSITLDAADSSLNRIDRVVIRLDKSLEKRYVKAFILKGEASENPTPPPITRDENIYEISLAQVEVIGGKSFIENTEIIDERLNTNVCGMANSLITADTTEIFNQFQAWYDSKTTQWKQEWDEWWRLHPDVYDENFNTWRVNAEERFENWFSNQQTEGFVMANEKGKASGIPTLDGNAKVPKSQLPPMNYLVSNNIAKIKDGESIKVSDLAFLDKSTDLVEEIKLGESYRETYNKIIPEKLTEVTSIVTAARVQKLNNNMYASCYAYMSSSATNSRARIQVFKLDKEGNYTQLGAGTYTIRTDGVPYIFRGIEITDVSYSLNGQYAYIGFFIKANQNDGYLLVHSSVIRIDLSTGAVSQYYNKNLFQISSYLYYRNSSSYYRNQTIALGNGKFIFIYLLTGDNIVSGAGISYSFVSSSNDERKNFQVAFPNGVSEIRIDRTDKTFGQLGEDSFSFLIWGNNNSRWYICRVSNVSTSPSVSYELLSESNASYKYLGSCFYNNEYSAVYRIGDNIYKITENYTQILRSSFTNDNPMVHIGYPGNSGDIPRSQVEGGDKLYFSSTSSITELNISNGEIKELNLIGDVSSSIHNQTISLVCSLDNQNLQVISKYLEYQGGLLFTEYSRIPVNKNLIQVKEILEGNRALYELTLKGDKLIAGDKVYLDLIDKTLERDGKVSNYLGRANSNGSLSKPLIKTKTLYYRDLYVTSLLTIPIPECDKVKVHLVLPSSGSNLQLIDVSLDRRSLISSTYSENIAPKNQGEYHRITRGAIFETSIFGTLLLDLNINGLEISRAPKYSSPTGTLTIKEIIIEVINYDAYSL